MRDHEMIYIQNKGRLGNQLFIYALYKELKYLYPEEEFIIDNNEIDSFNFDNELINYNIDSNIRFVNGYKDKPIFQKLLFHYYIKRTKKMTHREIFEFEKKHQRMFNFFGLNICMNGYLPLLPLKRKKNCFFGFFQSEKYFSDVKEELRKDLSPKKEKEQKNSNLYCEMEETNSVCLTVRRGDYINHPIHDLCNIEYFNKALEIIGNKVKNPVIFAFSDDIEWVKNNIKFKYPVHFEDGTDSVYEKLRMMSSCKHFILSNSSFSWWACYLSNYSGKIVISPNRWFNIDIPCDLINENWILIDVEQ